jgi:2-polyprenyl-3-methyl-5-hydroxy-6-metoxy-1,4-benzoquinol methylase
MPQLTSPQQSQENSYIFPYHYLSLYFELYRRVNALHYLTLLQTIKEMLGPLEGQRLLDAGCGDGRFCYELAGEHIDLVGVDYSERAIAFAKAFNPSVEFHLRDLTNLQFEEEFDIITLIDVLEHFPMENVSTVVANLWKALRPSGRLLVSVPTTNMPLSEKHYQHFTVESLEKLLAPMFDPVTKTWKHCVRLQKCARLIWPLRNSVPGINRFVSYVENYYHKKVKNCEPEEANAIIEIFHKKNVSREKVTFQLEAS